MTAFPLDYEPHPAQRAFHRAVRDARFALAVAGRRGGKTQAGPAEMARRIVRDAEQKLRTVGPWKPARGKDPKPWLHYCVVGPTYALIDQPRIALQRYLGVASQGGLILDGQQGQTEWWLKGGIRIDLRSGDRPERLVSPGYNGVLLDEAARLKPKVWSENLRPTLSDTQGWAIFTSTPLGRNWLWEEVFAKADPSAAAEVAKMRDCRVEDVLDPNYVAATWTTAQNTALPHLAAEMEQARRELPEEQFARNYLATFDVFPGQIFRLVETRHLIGGTPNMDSFRRLSAGIDIGSTHLTAVSLVGELNAGGWEEIDTLAGGGILFDDSADWARRDTDGAMWTSRVYRLLKRFVGDRWRSVALRFPADRPDVAEQFRRRGFNVQPAFQSHEPAVSWCQTAFHAGRLRVRSSVLWRCLLTIRRPELGERSTKAWVDKDDDPWDALRYALSEPISLSESPTGTSLSAVGWMAPR